MRQDLQNVVLVCPDNDAESRMILLIAYRLGMCVIRSGQAHGATLERERGGIVELVQATGKREAWIVEMPGLSVEKALHQHGIRVILIDHHSYSDLDRTRDNYGRLLLSSLQQFLDRTQVNDDDLVRWGMNPRTVRGIGIFDAKFVQGLREADYTQEDIREVMNFRREHAVAGNPNFEAAERAAREAWNARRVVNGFIVVESKDLTVKIRGAVSEITILENCDTKPFILVDRGGEEVFVQNVDPRIVNKLMDNIKGQTFSFGSDRCWGVNNLKGGTHFGVEDIFFALSR